MSTRLLARSRLVFPQLVAKSLDRARMQARGPGLRKTQRRPRLLELLALEVVELDEPPLLLGERAQAVADALAKLGMDEPRFRAGRLIDGLSQRIRQRLERGNEDGGHAFHRVRHRLQARLQALPAASL